MSQMNTGAGSGQQPGAARPGQMTAVMRAMAQVSGPKVLRIGVVQGGRVIEERIIKQRTTVTVGPSEKAMFVVQAASVPSQFRLFELIGADYYLNFLDAMSGRVSLATGISDLGALRGQAKRVGNGYQVKLTEEARGKIVVGDVTFLFQFVAPPPVQPRPQLPLSVKGGLASQIDWNLTIIAAFSFMMHFGIVGAMYSDWMDPVVSDESAVGLIDMIKSVPSPPVEEPKKVEEKKVAETKATEKKDEGPKKQAADAAGAGKKVVVSDKQAAALAKEAQSIGMSLLAAFGGGSAVAGALNRGEIPPVDLSGAAASGAAVHAGGDLAIGKGGGPIAGGKSSGLGNIVASTGQAGSAGAGKAQAVEGPKGEASTGPASTIGGAVEGVEQTVAKLRTGFRSCYNKGLQQDPGMSGAVTVAIKISANGEVDSATSENNTGLSEDVVSCIIKKVRNANFSPPAGGSATVKIPIKFVQQK